MQTNPPPAPPSGRGVLVVAPSGRGVLYILPHEGGVRGGLFFAILLSILLCSLTYLPALAEEETALAKSHAISIYGDVKYPSDFTHFDYVNPNAPKGGEIILPEIGTFDSLNGNILKGKPAGDLGLLFDTLMTPSMDETATNYGLVAEYAEVPESGKYIIFYLNPKAKFSDGTKITADDVVFTFNIIMEKGHPYYKIYYGEIAGVEKLSDSSVKFNFKNPKNKELKYIIGQLPVLSKKYYESHEFEKTTLEPPLGSGPYLVDSVEQGRQITYKRNPDYWAKDLPVNQGMYNFDRIRHEYYMDVNVAIQAFKSGSLDLRYENVAKNWATAYNIPAVESGKIKKEKIYHQIPTGMQAFAFNIRRDKFKNKNIRKAISYVLDFEWMNENLFYGSYERTQSYFENSIYAARGLPEGRELELLEEFRDKLPAEVFNEEFTLPKSDGSGRIRKRLLQARNILEQEGYKIKDGVLIDENGKPFEVEFLLQNGSSLDRLMPSIVNNLKILGIETKLRAVDASQYKQRMDEFDYDLVTVVWGQSNSPGNEQMNYWHSANADTKGSRNYIGIKNPVVDALVERLIIAEDKEDLVAICKALDRVMLWEYYVIPHFYAGYFRILYWDKFARPETLPKYDSQFGLWTWWVK